MGRVAQSNCRRRRSSLTVEESKELGWGDARNAALRRSAPNNRIVLTTIHTHAFVSIFHCALFVGIYISH